MAQEAKKKLVSGDKKGENPARLHLSEPVEHR
jgi:hypothetical protein